MKKPSLYDVLINDVETVNDIFINSIKNIYFVDDENINRIKKELDNNKKSIIETAPLDICVTKTKAFHEFCNMNKFVATITLKESRLKNI